VAPGAADFPDSLVGLAPSLFEDRPHAADDIWLAFGDPLKCSRRAGSGQELTWRPTESWRVLPVRWRVRSSSTHRAVATLMKGVSQE